MRNETIVGQNFVDIAGVPCVPDGNGGYVPSSSTSQRGGSLNFFPGAKHLRMKDCSILSIGRGYYGPTSLDWKKVTAAWVLALSLLCSAVITVPG